MFSRLTLLPSARNAMLRSRVAVPLFQQLAVIPPVTDSTGFYTDSSSTITTTIKHCMKTEVRHFKTMSWRRRSIAVKNRLRQAELKYKKPGQVQAISMPLSPQEMDNTMLVVLSQMDHHGAQIEVLKRHVMSRDKVTYDTACLKYKEIATKNRENMYLLSMPYQLGVFVALSSGLISLPLVFHHPTAHWFNNNFVTCVVPEPHELETVLEIGIWTWNWMEPPLGTISFLLLTFQVARANMQNIGAKPYTARVKQWRAERLAAAFPQYDASILIQYSNNTSLQESQAEIDNS